VKEMCDFAGEGETLEFEQFKTVMLYRCDL